MKCTVSRWIIDNLASLVDNVVYTVVYLMWAVFVMFLGTAIGIVAMVFPIVFSIAWIGFPWGFVLGSALSFAWAMPFFTFWDRVLGPAISTRCNIFAKSWGALALRRFARFWLLPGAILFHLLNRSAWLTAAVTGLATRVSTDDERTVRAALFILIAFAPGGLAAFASFVASQPSRPSSLAAEKLSE
jgi:hypothetical protein